MAGWLGIDISKARLECADSESGETWQVPNTPEGWHAMTERYATCPPVGVVMEATGALYVGLHLHLTGCGWHSSVVNPSWTAHYASSRGTYGKTDRVDARMLARYGAREAPAATPVKSPQQSRLMALMRRREQVVKLRVMNENQRGSALTEEIMAFCDELAAALDAQIAALDAVIEELLTVDPSLHTKVMQLRSMPGIGPVASTWLICALPELGELDRRKIAALAGLAPHPKESGSRGSRRRIRGGRKQVTRMLFLAARVAVRHDPYFRAYFTRYMARPGKAYKMGVIAVANKMLTLLSVMVRDGLLWTDTHAYTSTQPAPIA